MGKRKQLKDVEMKDRGAEDSGSDEDLDVIDVDFEWFDPQPAVDFHGLKGLLRQLFDSDSQLFDLSALSDLILSQPLLGSTVKVDGNETDPYAFLTVLNLQQHKDVPVIKSLTDYIRTKSSTPGCFSLNQMLSQPEIPEIGLILTERLINVPAQVVPPMYTMLLEEISWALEEKEPYRFTHYLIISKTYKEVVSKLDEEDDRPQKKKKKAANESSETFYFHPEDEILHKYALCHEGYNYTHETEGQSDSKRAFQELGIHPQGHMILIEASKFEAAVVNLKEFLNPSS
ncbi:Mss4p nuclear export [Arthroderma sp. PD_2]|nr:Mss4p nuclear export [Arthroderma sp. PD_2]